MNYYIFKIEWSQTESGMKIVRADSFEKAKAQVDKAQGARYIHYLGTVFTITEV